MSPLVHGLAVWLIALIFVANVNDRRLIVIAGVAADIDGVFILFDRDLFSLYHHTFGHSFVFGLLVALTAGMLAKNKFRTGTGAIAAFSGHIFLDLIGSNLPMKIFYPLDPIRISLNSILSKAIIYELILPLSFVIVITIVAIVVYLREISPLEFISAKLDKKIVRAYVFPLKYRCDYCGKIAFAKCETCKRKICATHLDSFFKSKCDKCSKKET
jgi:membrane-bound metal-dependent hydrolase YbcI (DUF457 family)